MRLHVAIVTVLFLGVFRVANSQEDFERANVLEERCRKNGGPYAFVNFSDTPQYFTNCLVLKTNLHLIDPQISTAPAMIRLATDLCVKRNEVDACIYDSTKTVKACYDAEDHKYINTLVNIYTGVSDYICKDDAKEFLAFSTSDAFTCFLGNQRNISGCLEIPSLLMTHKAEIPPGDVGQDAGLQNIMTFLKFDAEACRNLNKTEQCIAKVMEKCKSDPNYQFVSNSLAAAKKKTACSGSARGSTIPSVLMFVATVTLAYLPFA